MVTALEPSINRTTCSPSSETKKTLLDGILEDLDRCQELLGDTDIKTAHTWTSLGLIRLHLEHDAQGALTCFKESLRIFMNNDDLKSVATTWNDLGLCFERLEMYDKALKSYMKARDIFEAESFSASHPCIVSSQRSIGRLLRK
jgi:tetratricopeptide (TPR) repeat protein